MEIGTGAGMEFVTEHYIVEDREGASVLHIVSTDHTNKLTRARVAAMTEAVEQLAESGKPLVITGNEKFFSAGADLNEVTALSGPAAYEFSRMGNRLMNAVDRFPALVIAAVRGYCLGGGLDLALACDLRFAARHAVFGHRGAALGLITGWGGTQRLPRLVGRARAVEIFATAEKLSAARALEYGLVEKLCDDPVSEAVRMVER